MDNERVDFIYKLLIALGSGIFGLAIAIAVQHIKIIGIPRALIFLAIAVQLILSLGVFLGVCLVFKSSFLPEVIPNDDWSVLTAAYLLSSIPHITIAALITIYNKEINKRLKERYGESNELTTMENVHTLAKLQDIKDKKEQSNPLEPKQEPNPTPAETNGDVSLENKRSGARQSRSKFL